MCGAVEQLRNTGKIVAAHSQLVRNRQESARPYLIAVIVILGRGSGPTHYGLRSLTPGHSTSARKSGFNAADNCLQATLPLPG